MAGLPIPLNNNDIIEVRYVQDLFDQRLLNVLHYRAQMTVGAAEFPVVVAAMDAAMKATNGVLKQINGIQTANCVNVRNDYQIVAPGRFSVVTTTGLGAGMGITGEYLATPNTAVVVTKRGQIAKKGGAGSVHIGGVDPEQIQGGQVAAATQVKMALLGTAIASDIPAGQGITLRPIIFNRITPVLSQEVATTTGQFTTRVMRRRTRGVGV